MRSGVTSALSPFDPQLRTLNGAACRSARCRSGSDGGGYGGGRYAPNSLQMQDDRAFRNSRCGDASIAGVLTDPFPRYPNALVGAGLVLEDGQRNPTVSGADQG